MGRSPLEYPDDFTDVIIEAAKAGVPTVIVAEVMVGATAPISLAGAIVQHNAEVLGGIVLSQLASKGAPILYGSTSHIMDIKFATPSVGRPEFGMLSAALSQMAKLYKLPCMMAGG